MTTQPALYDAFPEADQFDVTYDTREADVANPVLGILLAFAVCLPFWAAVYLLLQVI